MSNINKPIKYYKSLIIFMALSNMIILIALGLFSYYGSAEFVKIFLGCILFAVIMNIFFINSFTNIKNTFNILQNETEEIAASSEELSKSSVALSNSIQSESGAIEDTAASMQELSKFIEKVAKNAQSQAVAVEEITASIEELHTSIKQLSEMAKNVREGGEDSVTQSAYAENNSSLMIKAMESIEISSNKIQNIVDVINDIADQTNLLALNASIEAARAGDAGRGFAVVAKEISKLADKSALATKEIVILINETKHNVIEGSSMVQKLDDDIKQMRKIAMTAAEMGHTMSDAIEEQKVGNEQISESIQNINSFAQEIAEETEKHKGTAVAMDIFINAVSDITQGSASNAEEMSAAIEGLTRHVEQFKKMFQVLNKSKKGK